MTPPTAPKPLVDVLEKLPYPLLSRAEVHHDLSFERASLNLFSVDHADVAALQTFVPDEDWTARDARMRAHFRVRPRRWVKITPGDDASLSEYYQLVEGGTAAIRLFLHAHGAAEGSHVTDAAFGRLTGRSDVDWGLVVKHDASGSHPRVSVRLPTTLVADVLASLRDVGYLGDDHADALRHTLYSLDPADAVYLSVDPTRPEAVGIDVPTPEPEALRDVCGSAADWLTGEAIHFLKFRFDQGPDAAPTFTVYRPAGDTLPKTDHGRYVDRVRAYYDATTPIIERTFGGTYQAALLGVDPEAEYEATASTLRLGERMRLDDAPRHLLDVGCGLGGPAIDLAREYPNLQITGVNVSDVQVARARERIAEAGLEDRIHVVQADFHDLPFPDGTFDGAYAFEALSYASDLHHVARELARVLRPEAWLYAKEIVRAAGPLDARQREQLAEHDHTYAMRTPTLPAHLRALEAAGFDDLNFATLDDEVRTEPYQRRMFDVPSSDAAGLFAGFKPPLSAFGRMHHHAHDALPLSCVEVRAKRPIASPPPASPPSHSKDWSAT